MAKAEVAVAADAAIAETAAAATTAAGGAVAAAVAARVVWLVGVWYRSDRMAHSPPASENDDSGYIGHCKCNVVSIQQASIQQASIEQASIEPAANEQASVEHIH